MWFQILRDGGTARGVEDVLAAYRQRSDSKTANKLKSARLRWRIYREHLKLPLGQSVITMLQYGFYGLKKFKRI